MRHVELPGGGAQRTPRLDESPVRVELRDARVHVAIRDENIALLVEGDVGRPVELVSLHAGADRTSRRGRRTTADTIEAWHRQVFGCASENHLDVSLRAEFDDRAGPLVDCPDVVLRVDTNGVREDESVKTQAKLAPVFS